MTSPTNLLMGQRAGREPPPDADEATRAAYDRAEQKRSASVRANREALKAMHRVHLQKYMPQVRSRDACMHAHACRQRT